MNDETLGLLALLANAQYAKPGPYQTPMTPDQQSQFYQWARKTNAPITQDYDMPGLFLSGGQRDPKSLHYVDTYKTPMHQSFSNESKYAYPTAPMWMGKEGHEYQVPGLLEILGAMLGGVR